MNSRLQSHVRLIPRFFIALCCILLSLSWVATARTQESAGHGFVYQGQLYAQGGAAITAPCDFVFSLFAAATDGAQVGQALELSGVQVSQGIFDVELDFGAGAFDGGARWLEIQVKCSPGAPFSQLAPRQRISPTPYAHYAFSAAWNGLTGVPAGLADGDDDTLAGLSCAANQVALWNGNSWICAASPSGPQGPAGPQGAQGLPGATMKPVRVVWVAESGGDFTSVGAALAAITDAADANRYLIKIAPGIYAESIDLKSYVDIEGSGENVTIIRGTGSNTNPEDGGGSATLRATGGITSEVRFLSVESVSTDATYAIAIRNIVAVNGWLRYTHVTASASGGSSNNGVYNGLSSPVMNHVTASASGGDSNIGVVNYSSSPAMNNVTASASGGVYSYGVFNHSSSSPAMNNVTVSASGGAGENYGVFNHSSSSPAIRNSAIAGSAHSIYNDDSTAKVANTMLSGSVSGASFTCVSVHNADFVALGANCQ